MTVTSNQFYAASQAVGNGIVSTATGKPFTVAVRGADIYVAPQSTKQEQRRSAANNIASALAIYNQTHTLRPSDYSKRIAHSSYFVGLLRHCLSAQTPPAQGTTG